MMQVRLICTVLLCLQAALAGATEIVVTGSSTLLPVVRELAPLFSERTGIRVNVSGGGSDAGLTAAARGTADIGMVSRALLPGEGHRLAERTIGHDGVAVIVNRGNPIDGLSSAQVREIFVKRIEDWQTLGWRGGNRIVPVIKSVGRSTRLLFDQKFGIGNIVRSGMHEVGANLAMVLFVAADPQSIGYVSIGTVADAMRRGVKIKALQIDGVEPSLGNCMSSYYALCRPLLLVARQPLRPETRRFLDFAVSAEAAEIVRRHGFEQPWAAP